MKKNAVSHYPVGPWSELRRFTHSGQSFIFNKLNSYSHDFMNVSSINQSPETQMYSIGLARVLRTGCYAEYKTYHDELWPELAKSMTDNDVSIAIFSHGEQLFVRPVRTALTS